MAEDTEYIKLPLLDRCSHKLWKARVHGYTEAAQLFQEEDEKSPVFGQYLGLLNKFVSDSHAAAQEKGLEATLHFVENASVAGKTVKDVMSAIVAKSIAATKKNTQDLSLKITLMYIEIEKQDSVVEELIKGLDYKNPKIVAACLTTLTTCLKEFGSQVVGIKPLIKPIQNLIEDRDKTVRGETKALLIEIFRWIGESIKPLLTKLKPVQLTELEIEFAKIRGAKAVPTRYLRSQQSREEKVCVTSDEPDNENLALVEEDVIDPLSLIDPINILSKIPNDFYEQLEAKKWQDRKSALENLDTILDYPKFEKNDYGDLIRALLKIINKDSNVVVVGIATKCVARLALGLKKNFHPYANATLSPLLAKFKEKKVNVVTPLREAVDAVFPSTSLESIMEDVIASLDSKNPSIKAETVAFLGRCFAQSTPTELNKKLLKPYVTALLKTLNEPDPNVRDTSAETLGTAMKVVSEKIILPFLGDIDAIKLTKIKECCEKAVVKVVVIKKKPEPVKQPKPTKPQKQPIKNKQQPVEEILVEDEVVEVKKTNEKIDFSTKITEELLADLSNKDWKTRNDSLLNVLSMLIDLKIKPCLGELPAVLVQRFVDSNSKIIATALEVCGSLAVSLGPGSKNYVQTFARGILNALADSKQQVRSAALACLKTWTNEAGAKEFFYGETIPDILKTTSSNVLKNEVWTWLGELLPTVKVLPKDELCLLIPCLFSALEDRNADVRKAGNNAVFGLMMHVGYQNMLKEAEKLKPASKSGIIQLLDKIRPDVPELEPPSKPNVEAKRKMAPPKSVPTKKVRNSICPSTVQPKPKKEEDIDTTPLLLVNKLKNQRVLDEQKLKILKWNFTTPRQEFVELLKDQMNLAGFNKTLIVNMFHADFKFHLKAIESLIDDLYNQDALTANLDLILKWMTLRFFDTNPSVLLKGLEYLQSAFTILIDKDYAMFDLEANSFVPYLVMKIGDPKDTVRDRVRTILRQFSMLIPPGKLFLHVMDGLKSKNSRLRSESLDELGHLIEQFGTSVCLPSSAVALKEISKQIADRNNTVRSAALNTIVKAYFVDGDKIYKQIGKLSDKDMSYLEERVKRASQNRTKIMHDVTTLTSNDTFKFKKPEPEIEKIEEEEDIEIEQIIEKEPTPKSSPIIEEQPSPKYDFPNPYEEYWKIENPIVDLSKFDINIDDSFLYKPIFIPENIFPKMKYSAPINPAVEELFRNISNDNPKIAIDNLKILNGVINSELTNDFTDYSNGVFDALICQLEKANSYSADDHGPLLGQLYKAIFKNIDIIFETKTSMAKNADKLHIKRLIQLLLNAFIEQKTKLFDGGDLGNWISVFIANIVENSDATNLACSIIESLRDLVDNPPKNRVLYKIYKKFALKIVTMIKKFNNLDEIFNLNDVLFSCHLFMENYSPKTSPDFQWDGPLKSFNVMLVSLITKHEYQLFNYFKNIEDPTSSVFVQYLKKMVDANSRFQLKDMEKEKDRKKIKVVSHSTETSILENSPKSVEMPPDFEDRLLYYFHKLIMFQKRLGYPESTLSDFEIPKNESQI